MREKSLKNFKLESKIELRKGGVKALSYYNVEFGEYIREKALELRVHIRLSSLEEKRVFLQSFFDDEGNISFNIKRSKRQVRGFQYDLSLLRIVRILLMDFGIPSTVDETYKEIIISRKGNLMKFRDFINFSEGIYINPERTNSIWKRELSKRQLLNMAIESYRPLGAPGVHKSPRFS
ncbi:MAG: LAGLIDADG family homing endonuclease [Candidatus Yanofskybacteria bacterium]|nr:LAGLIDADG family homing endonuclease [Candidatus Yanofskybacteria bacterium]